MASFQFIVTNYLDDFDPTVRFIKYNYYMYFIAGMSIYRAKLERETK